MKKPLSSYPAIGFSGGGLRARRPYRGEELLRTERYRLGEAGRERNQHQQAHVQRGVAEAEPETRQDAAHGYFPAP